MKKTLISTFLFCVSVFSYAQNSNPISKLGFERSVDKYNYEYLLYLLEDRRPTLGSSFKTLGQNEVSFTVIENFLKEKKAEKVYFQIANEINNLKKKDITDIRVIKDLFAKDIYLDYR